MALCTGATGVVYGARDVVSTYLAVPARAIGLGWFADQRRPMEAAASHQDCRCTLNWRRSGPTTAKYTLRCEADRDVDLYDMRIMVTRASADPRDPGAYAYETQWPNADARVRVQDYQAWVYKGQLEIGVPIGEDERAVAATFHVALPRDDDPTDDEEFVLISRELP